VDLSSRPDVSLGMLGGAAVLRTPDKRRLFDYLRTAVLRDRPLEAWSVAPFEEVRQLDGRIFFYQSECYRVRCGEWARGGPVAAPYSGTDGKRGLHFVPEKATEVLVGWTGRFDTSIVLLGNARSDKAEFASPSIYLESEHTAQYADVHVKEVKDVVIDSDLVDVTVPDYTAPQVTLTSLEVLRARTAIEFRQLSADPAPMPVADREFRRTERLLIRFAARAPGEATPETTVRLLNRAGQRMSDLTAQPLAGDPGGRLQVDLPLASLPSGEYVVEGRSVSGESEAKQFVGFKVVS
jgi:hypothetical protein